MVAWRDGACCKIARKNDPTAEEAYCLDPTTQIAMRGGHFSRPTVTPPDRQIRKQNRRYAVFPGGVTIGRDFTLLKFWLQPLTGKWCSHASRRPLFSQVEELRREVMVRCKGPANCGA